jgi:hypothetical protein
LIKKHVKLTIQNIPALLKQIPFFKKKTKCHSIELNRKSSITAVGRHHSPRDFIKFPKQKKKMYVERINRNIGMNESVMIAAAVNPSQSVEHIFEGKKKCTNSF